MKRVVVTGGFGFIGSNLISYLNKRGIIPDVIIRNINEQWRNVTGLSFKLIKSDEIALGSTVIALGANVDTTEHMNGVLWENNVDGLIKLWRTTQMLKGRFIYASSGSVYGSEERDFAERIYGLKPLNAYAFTKWNVDNILFDGNQETNTYGLRFTNIYGPRETYKGTMASLVHKGLTKQYPIYLSTGGINNSEGPNRPCWSLFKSYRYDIKNGEQSRDFCYVDDVCNVIGFFLNGEQPSGVYNVGSGTSRTFNELVKIIDPNLPIKYVDMPETLRAQYQYHTRADLSKLRLIGYEDKFLTLEEGIEKMRAWLRTNG